MWQSLGPPQAKHEEPSTGGEASAPIVCLISGVNECPEALPSDLGAPCPVGSPSSHCEDQHLWIPPANRCWLRLESQNGGLGVIRSLLLALARKQKPRREHNAGSSARAG